MSLSIPVKQCVAMALLCVGVSGTSIAANFEHGEKRHRWPQATIPFYIADNLSELDEMSPKTIQGTAKENVYRAMEIWTESSGGLIKFEEISPSEADDVPNYLVFEKSNYGFCAHTTFDESEGGARYGMDAPGSGDERIMLDKDCGSSTWLAIVVHELGHVLGFSHEHQRRDRDQWMIVNKDNNKSWLGLGLGWGAELGAYSLTNENQAARWHYGNYDPTSIMHYGPYQASKDRLYLEGWDGALDRPSWELKMDKINAEYADKGPEFILNLQRKWFENTLIADRDALSKPNLDTVLDQLNTLEPYASNPGLLDEIRQGWENKTLSTPTPSTTDIEALQFHYTGVDLRIKIHAVAQPRDSDTGNMNYSLVVTNGGAWKASNVVIKHSIHPDPNFTFLGYVHDGQLIKDDADSPYPCVRNGKDITCTYDTLLPNQKEVIPLRVHVRRGQSELWKATIEDGFTVDMSRELVDQNGTVEDLSMHANTNQDLWPKNNTSSRKMGGALSLEVILFALGFSFLGYRRFGNNG